ncbi:MAG: hypothetical protein U9P42_08640 [Candidatus Fermentibacteria bacterium]|nr:hypothetical protein [Candidatus Fermentibacteria bacterium]
MAPEKIDRLGTNALLYAFTKALHRAVGGSAAAVMRQAGPDMLQELGALGINGLDSSDLHVLEERLGKLTKELGFCDDISFEEDGDNLKLHVQGCSFWELTQGLKEEGIPPFACPFAGIAVALVEKNLGTRARIKEIVTEGERASLIHLELVKK